MSKIYLAFYKHKRKCNSIKNLLMRICDEVTRLTTHGKYSHCEIAVLQPDGQYMCYSSSYRDGGVRCKKMDLPSDRWDLLEIELSNQTIVDFYQKTKGMRYDLIGALGVVLKIRDSKTKYFCSEWCAECFGYDNPQRISPNKLFKLIIK